VALPWAGFSGGGFHDAFPDAPRDRRRGFTLIEIMIVIAVINIAKLAVQLQPRAPEGAQGADPQDDRVVGRLWLMENGAEQLRRPQAMLKSGAQVAPGARRRRLLGGPGGLRPHQVKCSVHRTHDDNTTGCEG
jgi:prepilin-type N-terminal cleavage/methylation domain-containing protein